MKRALLLISLCYLNLARAQTAGLSMKARLDQAANDNLKWGNWLTAGAITPSDAGTYYYSRSSGAPNFSTAFAIGSATKVVTGALLGLRARDPDGAISIPECRGNGTSTPMRDLHSAACPRCSALPGWRNDITLEQLATHQSGLPKVPTLPLCDLDDLWLSVLHTGTPDTSNVGGCLDGVDPGCYDVSPACAAPGTGYEYSNWGFYLLGNLLADQKRTTWFQLVSTRVLQPLGMNQTFVNGANQNGAVRAPDLTGASSKPPVTDPGGGLWATGPDMMRLLRYAMGLPPLVATTGATQLQGSRDLVFCDRGPGRLMPPYAAGTVGLGWEHGAVGSPPDAIVANPAYAELIWWKGGAWNKWRSFIAFMPSKGVGVFVLTNGGNGDAADEIVRAFLRTYL